MAAWKEILLTGTSPAGVTTGALVGAAQLGLEPYTECVLEALLQGATGGTLDIYLQSCVNTLAGMKDINGDFTSWAGPNWYDVCHFPQLAAAAAPIRYAISISRGYPLSATILTVNVVDLTPALSVNTLLPNHFGGALRMVAVAGAGTSAGAVQSIYGLASEG